MLIGNTFPQFQDTDGSPLNSGSIYFGVVGLNPQTNPTSVYWDDALTQPAVQPVRTLNGFVVRDGIISNLYAAANYSIVVRNKNEVLLYSMLDSSEFDIGAKVVQIYSDLSASSGSSLIGFIQAGIGAVLRTLQSKARDIISVKDFGVVGDGVTDDILTLQAAIDATKTRLNTPVGGPSGVTPIAYGVKSLLVNVTKSLLGNTLLVDGNIELKGQSDNNGTILSYTGTGKAIVVNSTSTDYTTALQNTQTVTFKGLHVQAYSGTFGIFVGASSLRDINFYGGSISGVTGGTGVELSQASYGCEFDGFDVYGCAVGIHFNNFCDIITVRNGWIGGNSSAAILAEGPTFNIENNNFEGNAGLSIQVIHRTGNVNGLRAGRIVGNRFGDETYPQSPASRDIEFTVLAGAGVSNIAGTVISDNKFFTGGGTPKLVPILINGPVTQLKIRGNFMSSAYTSGYLVQATAAAYDAYTGYDCIIDDIRQVEPSTRALFSLCDNKDFQRYYAGAAILAGFPVTAGSSNNGTPVVATLSSPITTGDLATQKKVVGFADYGELNVGRPIWIRTRGAIVDIALAYNAANDGLPIYLGFGALSFTPPGGKEPFVVGIQVGGAGASIKMMVMVG